MTTRKISTIPNHKLYRESLSTRRVGTISTDRVQPTPLGASDSCNEATGVTTNPKRYSSLRIRLRNRWGSENTQPIAPVLLDTRSISLPMPIHKNRTKTPLTIRLEHSRPNIRRLKRPSEAANSCGKPLPEIMIRFSFKDAPKTTRGMPMEWLVDPKVNIDAIESCMKGGADRVLDDAQGDKILLKIIWMPYVADIWYRIPILNDYSNPITRAELARKVARMYQKFMEAHRHDPFPTDRKYKCFKIGGPGMALCDMLLHSLTRLSHDEWEAKVYHSGF